MRLNIAIVLLMVFFPSLAFADTPKIVASFSILGDLVRQVGGDDIDVKVLVGPDGDAHVYQPTPTDAKAVASANLLIINGLGFEGWIERLSSSAGYRGQVVIASKGITPLTFLEDTHNADPHAWQNIANAKLYVTNIRDALASIDAAHATRYRANAEQYLKKLDALETWTRQTLDTVPQGKRRLITTHDAFQYFARAYGIEFIAPEGVSTESEASAADMAKLVDMIRSQTVRAVFLENISDPRLMRQLEKDAHAYIGGTLYSDALSAPGGPAPTYEALIRHNVTELTRGMLHNN